MQDKNHEQLLTNYNALQKRHDELQENYKQLMHRSIKQENVTAIYMELIDTLAVNASYSGRNQFSSIASEVLGPFNIGGIYLFLPFVRDEDEQLRYQCIDCKANRSVINVIGEPETVIKSHIQKSHQVSDIHIEKFELAGEEPSDDGVTYGYLVCFAKNGNSQLFTAYEAGIISALAKLIEIAEKTNRDMLTGLLKREPAMLTLKRFLSKEHTECIKPETLAFMVLDVDEFKEVNDTFGHIAGDLCLMTLGKIIADKARRNRECTKRLSDLSARWGGDEFVIVLPDTDIDRSNAIAKDIVDSVAQLELTLDPQINQCKETDLLTFSVSLGLAFVEIDECDYTESIVLKGILDKADKLSYKAKEAGRNNHKSAQYKLSDLIQD